ncbi:MAG: BrnA antitoxin family protein [Treponema sp.]|nr:BrnA antitoxin family protein [Treponema sp.]
MNTVKTLTAEDIAELKKRPIDFSDIPELTDSQAKELYPKNWRPRKVAVSARIDMDTIDWLKTPGEKGYLQRLNAVLRWAKMEGCPIMQL